MENNFVPECYFDTVLVKTILKTKHINHKKGCANVVKEINEGKLKDDFAVGIVDKDKKELDYLKDYCEEVLRENGLVLLKHTTKQHYFIQLVPAIEKWIINAANEGNVDLDALGFSNDLEKLKKTTKSEFASENEKLKDLCKKLVKSEGKTITVLCKWLRFLFEHNRNADINILKEDV